MITRMINRIKSYSDVEEAEIPTRFMKLTEELGEWSAAYLEKIGFKIGKTPKTEDELTDHVLEEGCDTLIMVLDVLFKQGFTMKEIEAKLDVKLDAWNNVIEIKEQRGVIAKENRWSTIIQNAMLCKKCGMIIKSTHVHDYRVCGCENNVMVDGGGEYFRCSYGEGNTSESLLLYDDSPFVEIKNKLIWGTYGKEGNNPLTWVKLIDCETDHLKAILLNCKKIGVLYSHVIETILFERGEL